MTVPERRMERSRDLERVLTFVDAIAAVAITLLILPLVELAGHLQSEQDSVLELLRSHIGQFFGFALSFAVIARLWLAQHHIMSNVIAPNRAMVGWLVLWAFAIVFLPFPTALLADGGNQPATKYLYIGTLAANALCLTLLTISIRRDSAVHEPGGAPPVAPAGVTVVLLLVALAISVTFPVTSYFPLLLLVATDAAIDLIRKVSAWRRTDRE